MRSPHHPRRRSCLSVPASSERMLAKAQSLAADEFVLDLEDAVAAGAKEEARELLAGSLGSPGWSGRTVAVRVNAVRTPWCHADLLALAALPQPPLSVVVPKVESGADVGFAERLLDGAEAPGRKRPIGIQALIETAAGLARVGEIAASSPRLEALIIGYADLSASLGRGAAAIADPQAWLAVQDAVLVAARAQGLDAIDGPHLGVEPDEAFTASARRARELGFDGKWAIHPAQVEPLNELFAPSEEEVERARAVLDAVARGERAGEGAVLFKGQMLDEAVRAQALRVLAPAGQEPAS